MGQEKYRAIAKILYKDARIVCLVYDITDRRSFEEIKDYWCNQIKNNAGSDTIIAVIANKSDLYDNAQVKNEEGEEYARSIKAIFQATSAKYDSGITNLFDNLGQKYFNPNFDIGLKDQQEKEEYQRKKEEERRKKKEIKGIQLTAEDTKKKKKKKCC